MDTLFLHGTVYLNSIDANYSSYYAQPPKASSYNLILAGGVSPGDPPAPHVTEVEVLEYKGMGFTTVPSGIPDAPAANTLHLMETTTGEHTDLISSLHTEDIPLPCRQTPLLWRLQTGRGFSGML